MPRRHPDRRRSTRTEHAPAPPLREHPSTTTTLHEHPSTTATPPIMPPADRPDHAEILAALRAPGDLRPRRLGPGDAAILPHAHLDLSGLADKALLAAIPHEWPLRGLWLGNSALGPDAVPALIELLARHPTLEHLELSGNSLGPRGLELLTPALAAHPGLRSLGLADNDLDGPTLDRLGQQLADHPLQHLRLAPPVPSTTPPVPSTTHQSVAPPVPSTTPPVPSTTPPVPSTTHQSVAPPVPSTTQPVPSTTPIAAEILSADSLPIRSLAFTHDGLLSAGDDAIARVWPLTPQGPPRLLHGHLRAIWQISAHPHADAVLTASADATARVWPRDGGPALVLAGHADAVWVATPSPDGTRIATISSDGTARLWRRHDDTYTSLLLAHRGTAPSAGDDTLWTGGFSPDGRHLLTAGADGLARVFPVTLADQLADACARAGRNLSQDEWTRLIGDRPYTPACP